MPKPRPEYGAIVTVYPASDSSSVPPTPSTPRTPLLGEHRCRHCRGPCECGHDDADDDDVELTEHERREYERGLVTWDRAKDWRFWIRREWIPLYACGALLLAAVSFVAVYHREVSWRKRRRPGLRRG
jgi:hypothetical protein